MIDPVDANIVINIAPMSRFLAATTSALSLGPSVPQFQEKFFVKLTSIIWLGSIAVNKVAGIDQTIALIILGAFALPSQIRGGLKAVALTQIVQVTLLVLGGLVVAFLTLTKIGNGDLFAGWHRLVTTSPDHFHMILKKGEPHDIDLSGLSVLIGGMWIANVAY